MVKRFDGVTSEAGHEFLRLHLARQIGPVCVRALLEEFGSVEAVFGASLTALERVEGVGPKRAAAIKHAVKDDAVDRELALAGRCGVRIICWADDEYPRLLRHISDPPICLYVKGRIQSEDDASLAIVGTRRCTHYGLEQAHRFGSLLAGTGFTVASGMARGADSAAHRGALDAKGRTVAVLGCGLGHIYPQENIRLAEQIVENGAILSALPMDTAPDPNNFPPRNRIIVGMSLGVLVIEAADRSGALISARLGSEYDREVFALPGRVDNPYAQGTNALIRDGGAKLVTCLEDILDELGEVGRIMRPDAKETTQAQPEQQTLFAQLDETERAIVNVVSADDTPLEHICEHSGLSPAVVAATLTRLQMKGVIVQRRGNVFALRNRNG